MNITIQDILISWLKSHIGKEIAYHDIEGNLPNHGKMFYGKQHNASSYLRAFRALRANDQLRKFGIKLEKVETKKKYGIWKIVKTQMR